MTEQPKHSKNSVSNQQPQGRLTTTGTYSVDWQRGQQNGGLFGITGILYESTVALPTSRLARESGSRVPVEVPTLGPLASRDP